MVQQVSMENSCTEVGESEIQIDDSTKCPTSSPLQKGSSGKAENFFSVYSVDFSSPADTWNIGEVGEEEEESTKNEESVGAELELKMEEHWLEWTKILHNPGFGTIEDDVFAASDSKDVTETEELKLLADHETKLSHCMFVPKVTVDVEPQYDAIRSNSATHLAEGVNHVGMMAPNSTLIGDTGLCKSSDDDSDKKQIDDRKPRTMNFQTLKRHSEGDSLVDEENCFKIPKVRRISSDDPTQYCFKSALEKRARKLVPGMSLEDALEIAKRRSTARIKKAMERCSEYNAQNRMMKEFEVENPWSAGWTHGILDFEF